MTPKENAKYIFNKIRFMEGENNKNCNTCDCVVLAIAKFMCDEFINEHSYDGRLESANYWKETKVELSKM